MLKRMIVFVCCFVFSLSVIAGCTFVTDYYRCANLQTPLFAVGISTEDDGGSGLYQGLGYTVLLEGELTSDYGYVVQGAEMRVAGHLVFAAIT